MEDYIYNSNKIYSEDMFPEIDKSFKLYDLSPDEKSFSVNSKDLIEAFKRNGIELQKNSVRRVRFIKVSREICLDCISDYITEEFENFYPFMNIEKVFVYPKYEIEALPDNYSVVFKGSDLRRADGYFYIEDQNREKIHFKYVIKASLSVVKSSLSIRRGDIVDKTNTVVEDIPFERFKNGYISSAQLGEIIAKVYIPKDRELLDRHVEKINVVERGSFIRGFIKDGLVYIEVEVQALQGGGVDDIIQIETPDGARLRAKIISRKLVKIL
jgi:flagella basal body P-ring formation protein FlgA